VFQLSQEEISYPGGTMNAEQALKITVDTVRLDSVLLGEAPNMNRLTFWLSELHYGRKWTGTTWTHCVPRDIIKHAANIAETHSGTAAILAAL
jgi:hypothetical protein